MSSSYFIRQVTNGSEEKPLDASAPSLAEVQAAVEHMRDEGIDAALIVYDSRGSAVQSYPAGDTRPCRLI